MWVHPSQPRLSPWYIPALRSLFAQPSRKLKAEQMHEELEMLTLERLCVRELNRDVLVWGPNCLKVSGEF